MCFSHTKVAWNHGLDNKMFKCNSSHGDHINYQASMVKWVPYGQDRYGSDLGTLAHVGPTWGHYWLIYFLQTYNFVLVIEDAVCFS